QALQMKGFSEKKLHSTEHISISGRNLTAWHNLRHIYLGYPPERKILDSNGSVIREKARWNSKIPLKIKVFMWNWQGDKICSIFHLVAWLHRFNNRTNLSDSKNFIQFKG
ncbi:hypothetical protein ACJX0J_034026, partial [Zea mays]